MWIRLETKKTIAKESGVNSSSNWFKILLLPVQILLEQN